MTSNSQIDYILVPLHSVEICAWLANKVNSWHLHCPHIFWRLSYKQSDMFQFLSLLANGEFLCAADAWQISSFGENSNEIANQSIHIQQMFQGDQAPPRATIFSGPISKDGLAANIEHPQNRDSIMSEVTRSTTLVLHVHNLWCPVMWLTSAWILTLVAFMNMATLYMKDPKISPWVALNRIQIDL
jgi:hypothetical protein